MHDMMAVNRAIEVQLLNEEGGIVYSVVLEHNENDKNIDLMDYFKQNEFEVLEIKFLRN